MAHNLLRLHRSLSTDLGGLDSPGKSIPLGYDEGFMSAVPPTAKISFSRLQKAFEIQNQIQDVVSPGLESMQHPTPSALFYRERWSADVEQDDTITSSTSHEPLSPSTASRQRTASMETTFSPAPSPEKPSEPEDFDSEFVGPPSATFLSVPRESQTRGRSLYLPPPNIPEYKPTPLSTLYESPFKRSRLEENGGKRTYGIPERRGSSSSGASSSGVYRTSPKAPDFTHVRSPADLPLPVSPADSSTDKVKSTPAASNINTADDMKNFLNAGLERKPVKAPSTPR
jgi:hypothetical protein